MWIFAVLALISGLVCGRPSDNGSHEWSTAPISAENRAWLEGYLGTQRASSDLPSGFTVMYVGRNREIHETKPSHGFWITVAGSPLTPKSAVYTAAVEVGKMLHNGPAHITHNIGRYPGAGLGIFTKSEGLTIFPSFQRLRDRAECKGRCDGDCHNTCTFDGRKYETLGGLTGTMSVVLYDNVMCTSHDPHRHIDNILVHEFGHTVMGKGMNSTEKHLVDTAYAHAKAHNLWKLSSYAMANSHEYWAEGTGAFFLVELQSSAGGMNDCGSHRCKTEADVRARMRTHDPQLFNILSKVYTNNHPEKPSGLKICPNT